MVGKALSLSGELYCAPTGFVGRICHLGKQLRAQFCLVEKESGPDKKGY